MFYIQNNNLGSIGAIKVTRGLQNVSTLYGYNISSNNISSEAADDIAAALSQITEIDEFSIDNNSIDKVGFEKITNVLSKRRLWEYSISVTCFGGKEIYDIVYNDNNLSIKGRAGNAAKDDKHPSSTFSIDSDDKLLDNIAVPSHLHLKSFSLCGNNLRSTCIQNYEIFYITFKIYNRHFYFKHLY